jgi:hypothetical protein
MTHEMGTIAHETDDVVGITEEVLALGCWAFPVATPVRNYEAKSFIGDRSLGLPLLGSCRQ